MVERTEQECRYSARWYIHVKSDAHGLVRGRTFYASTSSIVFVSQSRYREGDRLDLEIFVQTTQSVRCKAVITVAASPYRAEFVEFASGDQKVWNDTLLQLRRALLKR